MNIRQIEKVFCPMYPHQLDPYLKVIWGGVDFTDVQYNHDHLSANYPKEYQLTIDVMEMTKLSRIGRPDFRYPNWDKTFLVIGHKQHGKDSVCAYLSEAYGFPYASSSEFAATLFLRRTLGYDTVEQAMSDRANRRADWFRCIRNFNDPRPTLLAELLLVEHPVYCGMRNRDEFEACVYADLFDYVIWVDASARKEPESEDSMQLTIDDAAFVIDNNGTWAETMAHVDALMANLGISK